MKIHGATEEEKSLIKEVLSDYPHKDVTVEVYEGLHRRDGLFKYCSKTILVKRKSDIYDFHYILCHELCHYIQYLNGSKYSERDADEFGVRMTNKRYGTNWSTQRVKNSFGRRTYNKYLKVVKPEKEFEEIVEGVTNG
jgi:hypothetical protein